METFAPARAFVSHPTYKQDRKRVLASLDMEAVDDPIRGLINAFNGLPQCFTLQCCYGHFLHAAQTDPHNIERLPAQDMGQVQYRIAYLALCIENSAPGHRLRRQLETVPQIAAEYVQFGSPDWFWEQQPNTYALQVEPNAQRGKDVATIGYREALQVEEVRDLFFDRIAEVLQAASMDLGAA